MKQIKRTYYIRLQIIPKDKGPEFSYHYNNISYNKEESIEFVIKLIKDYVEDSDCTIDNFLDKYIVIFEIMIIPSYHLEFENNKELDDYCKAIIPYINKDNLYDFLLSISEYAIEVYDYKGNLMYGLIDIDKMSIEIYMSENDRGLPAEMFKEGDIVVRKNYPDDLYKVVYSEDQDFLHPEFPIHYTGTVFIAPLEECKDNGEELEHCIRYARTELIKVAE